MKLRGFQCDRCGKKYDKNKSKDQQHRTDFNLVSIGLINTAGQIFRTDLCDDCFAEFQTWLNNSNITITKEPGCCGCNEDVDSSDCDQTEESEDSEEE